MGKSYSNPNVNPNVVGTGEVIDNTLTAADLAPNSVSSSELADNAVDTAAIQDDAVTAAKIAANAVGSSEIAADAVGSSELADNAVDTNAIAALAVTGAKIANDTITATQIAADAIGSSELADNAVDTNAIAALAVTAAKIAANTITAAEIAADAIGSSELANNAVDTAAIADSAVTMAKLAASAGCGAGTDASKPAATAVPAGFLYLSTDVSGGTLYRSNGTTWAQAGSSVSAAGVADGGISTAKLADGAVTAVKLANDTPQVFTSSGSISGTGARLCTFAGSSGQTITLPTGAAGMRFTVLNIDASDTVLLARAGSDTINGAATSLTLQPGQAIDLFCVATNTWIAKGCEGAWSTVWGITNYMQGASAAVDYYMAYPSMVTTGDSKAAHVFDFDPADYAVAGRTVETRLVTRVSTNGTDPVTSGTLAIAAYRITENAGGTNVLVDTASISALAVSYSAAEITASLSGLRKTDSDVAGLTAGMYGVVVTPSATMITNSITRIMAMLQVRLV